MVQASNAQNNKVVRVSVGNTGNNPISLNTGSATEYYSGIAKQWATKTDGMVLNEGYSAKYWAQQTQGYAQDVKTEHDSAITDITNTKDNALTDITSAQTTAETSIKDLQTETETAVNDGLTTITNAKTEITTAKNTAISDIQAQEKTSTTAVTSAQTTATTAIDNGKTTALAELEESKNNAVTAVKAVSTFVTRDITEIITSIIPLVDAGLHLLDGALILGGGIYDDFVQDIKELYEEGTTTNTFTQPTLTSNGELGGSSFAVAASSQSGTDNPPYYAFNKQTDNQWATEDSTVPAWYEFYNPKALNVTKLTFTTRNEGEVPTAGYIEASDNGSDWTQLATFENTEIAAQSSFSVDLNHSNYYKYYKITATSMSTGKFWCIVNLEVTATELDTPNYFCTQDEWDASVQKYGVCGKFVYDSVNNTVRLPKMGNQMITTGKAPVTGSIVGDGRSVKFYNSGSGYDSDTYGKGIANYTGSNPEHCVIWQSTDWNQSGLTRIGGGYGNSQTAVGLARTVGQSGIIIGSDAYADLSNVNSTEVYYYIVLATSTKTEVQADVDKVATDLNGKADVSAKNFTAEGTTYLSGLGMPSDRYIDLTLGASGTTYTAPANGWVFVKGIATTTGGYLYPGSPNTSLAIISQAFTTNATVASFLAVHTGQKFTVQQWNMNISVFRFIYAAGAIGGSSQPNL